MQMPILTHGRTQPADEDLRQTPHLSSARVGGRENFVPATYSLALSHRETPPVAAMPITRLTFDMRDAVILKLLEL